MTKQVVKVNSNTKHAITAKEAEQLIIQERTRINEEFRLAYLELCKKFKRQLVGVPNWIQNGNSWELVINYAVVEIVSSDGNTQT